MFRFKWDLQLWWDLSLFAISNSLLSYFITQENTTISSPLPLPPPVSHKIPAMKIKRRKLCFRTSCGHSPREKKSHKNKFILIYIQASPFSSLPGTLIYATRIFPAVGELSQNPFYKQYGKENQKNTTRFWIRTWHILQFQGSKSVCPSPPFWYFNCISVLYIPPLLNTFISLATSETRQQFVEQKWINLWNLL